MTGNNQVPGRRHTLVNSQHLQAGDQLCLCDVARVRFNQSGSPDFATRFTGNQRIAGPVAGTEYRSAVHRLIKDHATGGLVLGTEVKRRWLINDPRVVFRMPGRKAEVLFASGIDPRRRSVQSDVEQFVEGIAVGKPRGPFLVCAEQVSLLVKSERDWKPNARADGFTDAEVRGNALNRATVAVNVPGRTPLLVHQPCIGVVCCAEAEVQTAVGAHGQSRGIHILRNLLPPGGHHSLCIRDVVAVRIRDQRDFAFRCHKGSTTVRISGRCQ